jgi:uncharacterized protein (TIGR03000 family)
LVIVPEDAVVWFNGKKMSTPGTQREFVSPPLPAGKLFSYRVRVCYATDNDKVVDETRTIYVRASDQWKIDFTQPAPKMAETLPRPTPQDR